MVLRMRQMRVPKTLPSHKGALGMAAPATAVATLILEAARASATAALEATASLIPAFSETLALARVLDATDLAQAEPVFTTKPLDLGVIK